MVKHNLKYHEIVGLLLLFVGSTWLGVGLYATILGANRFLVDYLPLLSGSELLIFPIFYGLGAILVALGRIELRGVIPGRGRK